MGKVHNQKNVVANTGQFKLLEVENLVTSNVTSSTFANVRVSQGVAQVLAAGDNLLLFDQTDSNTGFTILGGGDGFTFTQPGRYLVTLEMQLAKAVGEVASYTATIRYRGAGNVTAVFGQFEVIGTSTLLRSQFAVIEVVVSQAQVDAGTTLEVNFNNPGAQNVTVDGSFQILQVGTQ